VSRDLIIPDILDLAINWLKSQKNCKDLKSRTGFFLVLDPSNLVQVITIDCCIFNTAISWSCLGVMARIYEVFQVK